MSPTARFATLAARGIPAPHSESRPLMPPISLASVYVFDDMSQVDEVWEGRRPGHVYGRFGTPNHAMLEATLAALEGAEAALATASGTAALTALFHTLLKPGEHLVAGRDLYGGTLAMLRGDAPRWGIEVSYADATQADRVAEAMTPATRAIFVEAVSNPLLRLADLEGLSRLARSRGVALVVDNTLGSPALLRPLEHGATLVHHSVTKYLSGHADLTAGVLAGDRALVEAARVHTIRLGLNLGPFDAWLALRGVRTLSLRMARHCENALAVARYLAERSEVERVHYPGLALHPQHQRAARLFPDGCGGMVAFELRGGAPAVTGFFQGLQLIEFAPSFGDVTTTWTYPARTSHRSLSPAEQLERGIGPGLIRLSVGIEDREDLLADLARGLEGRRAGGARA